MRRNGHQQRLYRPFHHTRSLLFITRQKTYPLTSGCKNNPLKFVTLYCHKCHPDKRPSNNKSSTSFSHTSNKTTCVSYYNTKSSRTCHLKRKKTHFPLCSLRRRLPKKNKNAIIVKSTTCYRLALPF